MADLFKVVEESEAFNARCQDYNFVNYGALLLAKAWEAELKDAILISQGNVLDERILSNQLRAAYVNHGFLPTPPPPINKLVAEDKAAIAELAKTIVRDVPENKITQAKLNDLTRIIHGFEPIER